MTDFEYYLCSFIMYNFHELGQMCVRFNTHALYIITVRGEFTIFLRVVGANVVKLFSFFFNVAEPINVRVYFRAFDCVARLFVCNYLRMSPADA